jgi:hypothetical protein
VPFQKSVIAFHHTNREEAKKFLRKSVNESLEFVEQWRRHPQNQLHLDTTSSQKPIDLTIIWVHNSFIGSVITQTNCNNPEID